MKTMFMLIFILVTSAYGSETIYKKELNQTNNQQKQEHNEEQKNLLSIFEISKLFSIYLEYVNHEDNVEKDEIFLNSSSLFLLHQKEEINSQKLKQKIVNQISNFYLKTLYLKIIIMGRNDEKFYFKNDLEEIHNSMQNFTKHQCQIEFKKIVYSIFLNETTNPIESSDEPKIKKSNGTNHKIARHISSILRSLENINEKLGKIKGTIFKSYLVSYIDYLHRFPKYILELKEDMRDMDLKTEIKQIRSQFFEDCYEFEENLSQYSEIIKDLIRSRDDALLSQPIHDDENEHTNKNYDGLFLNRLEFMKNINHYKNLMELYFKNLEEQNQRMVKFRSEENEKILNCFEEIKEIENALQKRKLYFDTEVRKNYELKLIENYFDTKKNELDLIENYFVVSEFSRKHANFSRKHAYNVDNLLIFEDWQSLNLMSMSERRAKNTSPERGLFCNTISYFGGTLMSHDDAKK